MLLKTIIIISQQQSNHLENLEEIIIIEATGSYSRKFLNNLLKKDFCIIDATALFSFFITSMNSTFALLFRTGSMNTLARKGGIKPGKESNPFLQHVHLNCST
jgi:hypothetical protein